MEPNNTHQPQPTPPPAPDNTPPEPVDNDDWTAAEADFALEHRGPTPVKKEETDGKAVADKPVSDVPKPDEAPKTEESGDEEKKEEPVELVDDPTVREARQVQRELAEDKKVTAEEIRKEMFSEAQTELVDADGDPIRTIEDVQKLMNPITQKPFTEEEAAMYLLQAQQQLNKTIEETERQIEDIAEVNLSLKDQSDAVRKKWGDLLNSMPKLRDELWAEFSQTLVKDEKTNIITKAPVSLERFYDTALRGYAKSVELLQQQNEAAEKAKREVEKVQSRSDRQDIYSGRTDDMSDPEDKEWQEAAKAIYN